MAGYMFVPPPARRLSIRFSNSGLSVSSAIGVTQLESVANASTPSRSWGVSRLTTRRAASLASSSRWSSPIEPDLSITSTKARLACRGAGSATAETGRIFSIVVPR